MKLSTLTTPQQLFYQFCLCYKDRNMHRILDLCSEKISMWGSGVDEFRSGISEVKKQLQRDWSQSEKAEIEILSFVAFNELWAAAECKAKIYIAGQEYIFDNFRGSIFLTQEDNNWKIIHMHASFPDYRNPENNSFPLGV